MTIPEEKNYSELKDFALSQGAVLFGVADIKSMKKKIFLSQEVLAVLDKAISMAFRLSEDILADIKDKPTKIYYHHYRQVNIFLDQLALKVSSFLLARGARALPIPASQIIDWEKQHGHLSHKEVAFWAGLGWMGRNNLLVSPQYGAQIRLITVLTNMPLKIDVPLDLDCGDCKECIPLCPVNAIKEKQQDFDYLGCYEQLREFRKAGYTDQYICGLCLKPCQGKNKKIMR